MTKEEKKQETPKAEPAQAEAVEAAPLTKEQEALNVVKNRMYWSAGVGLVPVPVIDFLALNGILLEMLKKLSSIYGIPFKEQIGKSVVASLLASVIPSGMSSGVASMLKIIPIIGQVTGALAMSVIGGASTWAVGKVFIQHFESGGTFLDFDPEKVKSHFKQLYEEEAQRSAAK